jgi:hypothetical protein
MNSLRRPAFTLAWISFGGWIAAGCSPGAQQTGPESSQDAASSYNDATAAPDGSKNGDATTNTQDSNASESLEAGDDPNAVTDDAVH